MVAILDSGSMVTLVEERMVTSATNQIKIKSDKVAVSCIHGDTHYYPTVNLSILTPKGRCTGKVPKGRHLRRVIHDAGRNEQQGAKGYI